MATESTHVHHVEVTFDLLDPGNALYHAHYLVLADRARAAALAGLGSPVHELWRDGHALLVRGLTIEYRKPVFAGATLAIVTTVKAISASRLEVVQRFFLSRDRIDGALDTSSDRAVCELTAQLVCASLIKRQVDALPQQLLGALSADAFCVQAGGAP